MPARLLLALPVLLLVAPAVQAASFDCTKARTPFAKAICTHPDLSKADETLAKAFATALGGLSQPAAAEVSSAQDAWVHYANIACTKDARPATTPYDADQIACLGNIFSDRIAQLKLATTKGGLRFYFIDRYGAIKDPDPPDFGGTVGQKAVSTPRIDGTDPEALAFNHFIETGTKDDIDANMATNLKPDDCSEDDEATMSPDVVNPVRITMSVSTSTYGHGAAHPNYSVTYVHYLRGLKRRLVASDVFAGTDWQQKLQAIALDAVKKTEGDDLLLDDPTSINDIVTDPGRWDFSPDGLIMQFEPYEIAPYAVGAPTVTVPWSGLKEILAPTATQFEN